MIGQRGPIRSIASAIRLRENGWVDPDRPLAMLFLGSSGIGKTELAKRLAYYIHSDKSKDANSFGQSLTEIEKSGAFVRIDMSEYQHSHTASNLTGMYSSFESLGGVILIIIALRLTKRLRGRSFVLVSITVIQTLEPYHPHPRVSLGL